MVGKINWADDIRGSHDCIEVDCSVSGSYRLISVEDGMEYYYPGTFDAGDSITLYSISGIG